MTDSNTWRHPQERAELVERLSHPPARMSEPGTASTVRALADPGERTDMANRTCSIEGCDNVHHARGWCGYHYHRWFTLGAPGPVKPPAPERFDACMVEGCDDKVKSRNWCAHHYQRWFMYGDPLGRKPSKKVPVEDRFWTKVDRSGDCWEWTASRNPRGYGQILVDGKNRAAHRVSWQLHNGPIQSGMHVCHRCDNPPCVRPDHLWLGTDADNVADRDRKGRHARLAGERHPNARFSDEVVRSVRRALSQGESKESIADRFGMSVSYVTQLGRGSARKSA